MIAKIKIDYMEVKKGSLHKIIDIFDKFVSINVDGRVVDFGRSEVEIVAENIKDQFEVGQNMTFASKNYNGIMRQVELKKIIKELNWPIKKNLALKCLNFYIWG